jgi:hypothetical protein
MPVKTSQFIPLKPVNGRIEGKGYQCTACGLKGIGFNEPHVASAGHICCAAPEGQQILVKGHVNGSLIRTNPPAPETVVQIRSEMEQLGAQFQERLKAAEKREAEARAAASAQAAKEAEEIQAAQLAEAATKRDAALAAKK